MPKKKIAKIAARKVMLMNTKTLINRIQNQIKKETLYKKRITS